MINENKYTHMYKGLMKAWNLKLIKNGDKYWHIFVYCILFIFISVVRIMNATNPL